MIRSGYSFKTAVGHLPEVLARVQDIGLPAAPLADRNSTFGFVRWSKLTAKANIKPVYGVEIGVCPNLGEKKPVLDYWTFLAKDDLQPLHELLYTATKNPGKEPSLTYAQAFAANGVFKISGERVQLEHCQIQPDFFIGLSPATPKGLFNGAKEAGHQFLAMFNNYYTLKTDAEFYRIALGGRASNTQSYAQHILSDDEWRDALRRVASPEEKLIAILNRDEILENCNATLTKAQILVPEKPKTLYEMCREGAEILSVDLNDPKYSDRLDRELNLIIAKKFEDYFYIVADLVQFAKAKMLVGPGRGSSCGSLVCYLLRITSIDPLPHGLLFERFIDVTRNDLPDIDIDFSDIRRHLVFSYAEKKYGHDRVARLGTVGMFKPRSALNEVGKALRIPKWQIEKIIDNMIVRSSGDSRANQQIEDTLNQTEVGREILAHTPEIMIAGRMENHPANASQHAAGLIISEKPVINYVAIDARTGGSMCDKRDAEELNILKIDALGLKQLSIFERVLDLIGKPLNWLETLPLEDLGAFEVLNKEQFSGIFQFDGRSARSLIKDIKIECFNDLVIMNALARPGPLGSGAARSWVKRRTGQEPVSYPHALLEPHLVETLGLVIYQEQVMTIGREVGGLSWADVTALRKAMSKSLGAEHFDQYGDRWKTQAIANGLSPDVAMTFWAELCKFGLYGFNKCLSGNTKIKLASGSQMRKSGVTIAELFLDYEKSPSSFIKRNGKKPLLVSLEPDGRGRPQMATRIMKSGKKICWRYKFDDGSKVECTPDHRFIVNDKWLAIGKARIGDEFTSLRQEKHVGYPNGRGKGHAKDTNYKKTKEGFYSGKDNVSWVNGATALLDKFREKMQDEKCENCGKENCRMEAHHRDFNRGIDRPDDLQWLCVGCHKKIHYEHGRKKRWSKGHEQYKKKLVSAKNIGLCETYDIEMPTHHNFELDNGLVTHNSHAMAYALLAYYCCYLKAHHPFEFAAATLDSESEPAKQIELLRELEDEGVSYVAIDKEHSTEKWVPVTRDDGSRVLVGPLTNVKGIGPAAVQAIMKARREGAEELPARYLKLLNAAKTPIDTLYPVKDRVASTVDLAEKKIVSKPVTVKSVQCGVTGDVMIIAAIIRIAPRNENEAINVAKRGGRVFEDGMTKSLNLFFKDDTDEIFCKIDRYKFEKLGLPVIERGRPGRAIYAVMGDCPADFRMLRVKHIRYLCDLDDVIEEATAA